LRCFTENIFRRDFAGRSRRVSASAAPAAADHLHLRVKTYSYKKELCEAISQAFKQKKKRAIRQARAVS
jgi:hypothetical protein